MQYFTFLTDDLRSSLHYKQVEADFMGGLRGLFFSHYATRVRVYKPILMAFLTCKQVRVRVEDWGKLGNESADEERFIDGTQYVPIYVEGFLSGCAYFQKHYEVSADREYSDNYIKTIKDQFCDNGIEPWSSWYQPDFMAIMGSIGDLEIKEFGFKAGILSMIEQMAGRNKAIRDAIAPCWHLKFSRSVESYKPSYSKKQKVENVNNNLHTGFEVYIKECDRERLMPYLIEHYVGQKPKVFGYMLYALNSLGVVSKASMANQTLLHEALTATFGNVGSRQRLQQLIHELDGADSSEETNIRKHLDRIKPFLRRHE